MYKKQMILQRVVCYVVLIAAALVFVYSLGLLTDLYDNRLNYYAEDLANPMVEGSEIYYHMQEFNRSLTSAGIVLILLAASQFLFQNHARRKYYIANYLTVGVNAIAGVYYSVWALNNVFTYKEQYLKIDFETMKEYSEMFGFPYTESTFWFDISAVVFGVLLFATVINLANMFFKIVLMKAENKLIAEGKEA